MGSSGSFPSLGRGFGAALKLPLARGRGVVLWFCLAREPRGERASRSAEGESLDVSEATYETKRERSHGVVSSSSGRERPR